MINQEVKARCNLYGVLSNMEYLVECDSKASALVDGRNLAIQFNVKNGPRATLKFSNGKVVLVRGKHKSDITLYFSSPEKFNLMMEGEANPLPIKGFTKLGFLKKEFSQLADLLESYMRPDQEQLSDPHMYKANTEMMAYAAFFAVSEIGNYDERGKSCAAHIPDGVMLVEIKNNIAMHIEVSSGKLKTIKGGYQDPHSIMSFKDITTAYDVLNGNLDTFTAIALGDMEMRGFIPMIEHLDPILSMVSRYLQ